MQHPHWLIACDSSLGGKKYVPRYATAVGHIIVAAWSVSGGSAVSDYRPLHSGLGPIADT